MPENAEHLCTCGKSYKHRQSLCNHKKKCLININLENDIKKALRFFTKDKNTSSQMSKKAFSICDGKGINRVIKKLI